ncbi:MAG: HD domain-containing protein [Planctomycetota bacterium]|nr:MAG: HD domain-containing protein [Planctomycetota bacterium]REJ92770.1 MAG: HD domain-containing protein [Planctomycetota bacterium]REK29730.1 MAG: HD domain-containing protein [Planctomycetota bacterium]REK30449.1 MAG: HD domain-containing protein [Planctomycetota bacterium]
MTDAYSDIPELADLESGRSLVRIPSEQNVPFTPRVRALVDTAEFRRLTDISQLGLVSRVYPGARHSRFEHALGVFHNALRFIQQLRRDEKFRERIDRRRAEVLIASALLHDLGHWPFCHPIEDLALEGMPPHEDHAGRYLLGDTELASVLREVWEIDPEEVLDVIAPRSDSPQLRLLRSILSGPIDVDKMDYLERDSLHCGVPYGRNFDKQRLIQSLVVNQAGDGLALTDKGKTAAELMVFARYVMFSEVYWHHAVRSATSMFARCFFELHERLDLDDLFDLTDAGMIASLQRAAAGTPSAQLLDGVFGPKRRLYKRAGEYGHEHEVYGRLAQRPYRFLVECARNLAEELSSSAGTPIAPEQVLIDAPPPHREVEFAVDIYFPKRSAYRPLKEVSPVVDALARTQFDEYVKRVRVFLDPQVAESVRRLSDFDRCAVRAIEKTNS